MKTLLIFLILSLENQSMGIGQSTGGGGSLSRISMSIAATHWRAPKQSDRSRGNIQYVNMTLQLIGRQGPKDF